MNLASTAISVVVPTYDRNERLRVTLDSIAAQTYDGPIETIVVDGIESRTAEPVVAEYTDATYIAQRDLMAPLERTIDDIAAARTLGVRAANGEFVQFLDDDDRLRNDAIERKIGAIDDGSSGPRAVCTGFRTPSGSSREWPASIVGSELSYALIKLTTPCPPSMLLVDRSILTAAAPFERLPHDDLCLFIEVAKRTTIEYIDAPLTEMQSERTVANTEESITGMIEAFNYYESEGLYNAILSEVQYEAARDKRDSLRAQLDHEPIVK